MKKLVLIILLSGLGLTTTLFAQKYDFNNGTKQGWTMQGPYDDNGAGGYSSNFTFNWTNIVNYPTPDPGNPNKGSLFFYTGGGHGISGMSGTYWMMQFYSPDLSSNSAWQSATGYSVRIVENMTVGSELYANLFVRVWDYDQSKDRYFYDGPMQKLTFSSHFNQWATWNHLTFDWSNISNFPTNYKIKSIHINIWGKLQGLYQGQVGIDEVVATSQPTQSITVDVPNGGEIWNVGSTRYIRWHSNNFNDPVKIEYSTNGGSSYSTIVSSTANDGSYTWTVPNTPSTQCLVRISDAADGNPSDVSDATFTIPSNEFIVLDVPNGGESWQAGTQHIIVWHGQGINNKDVKIEYSTNNGATYNFIDYKTNTGTSGSYTWNIPNTPSTQCLVRVSVLIPPEISDASDNVFTISSPGGNNTPTGNNIGVNLGDVSVEFDNVTGAGNTTLNKKTTGPAAPSGFTIVPSTSPVYYDINTTATYSGNIFVCILYNDAGMTQAQEAALKLQVYEVPPGNWKDITISVDVNANIICGQVSHLTDFAVMAPTGGSNNQIISLPQGWSWISFNVQPSDLSIENVMSGVSNLAIVVNGSGQFYIPGVVNSIGQMNILEGYKIYVSSADQVSVTGQQVSVTTPMNLTSGWNFVSYLPTTAKSVETALASIISQLAIVKNDEGKFYIPNVVNSLGNMAPGEGYKLYLNANATLTYPQGLGVPKLSTITPATKNIRPSHFKFRARTGESYSVVVQSFNIGERNIKIGDEVGIFNSQGICVGAGVWDGTDVMAISSWADDEQTIEIDGFREGEEIHFKFWDSDKDNETEFEATFIFGNGRFGDGAFCMVELSSYGVIKNYSLEQNYPNPFNANTMISYHLSRAGKVELRVYSLLGKEIKTLVNEHQGIGSHSAIWDGRNYQGNDIPSGIYFYKLQMGGVFKVKRAVLIK